MKKMYEPETKERFLSTYDNEDTKNTIRYMLFYNSESAETQLRKDLYDFNQEEISKVIKKANPHNLTTAKTIGRFISQYMHWAINPPQLLRKNNINPMKAVDDIFYKPLVNRTKKIHYSLNEFIELLEDLPNAQDQALLSLLWEGLSFDEIKEIHYNDIRWNSNEIVLRERDGEIFKLNDIFMRFITNAYKATTYTTYTDDGEYKERELLQSDYLMKNAYSRRVAKSKAPVNNSIFYSRLTNVKNQFSLEYLTPNSLRQSGQIYMSVKLYEKYGKLEYEQFAEIGDKYGASMIHATGYTYYNTTLMKQYISESNIKELYNIDVQF